MFSVSTFFTLIVVVVHAVPPNSTSREELWPEDLQSPFPYPTPSPCNIDASDARNLSDTAVPSDLVVRAKKQVTYLLTNRATYLEVSILTPNSLASIGGGFLGSFYLFDRARFFWAASANGSASASVNGVVPPVEARLLYRNSNYSSFSEALRYRDGIVSLVIGVKVSGVKPNSNFDVFCRSISQVKSAGQSTPVVSSDLFGWLDPNVTVTNYLALPGAYIYLEAQRQQAYVSTIISFPPEFWPTISVPQFSEFLTLRNGYGQPYTNILVPQPLGTRPVVVGSSITIEGY